jgi:hypothetical protein
MRWRFADRITALDPWMRAEGTKAVTLEEYSLLEAQGREGELPESLALECCVQLVRWLVAASSNFELTAELESVRDFRFLHRPGMGDALNTRVTVTERSGTALGARCELHCGGATAAEGHLAFRFAPLREFMDPDALKTLWSEIGDPASRKE